VKIVGPKDAVEISWDCPARLKLMAYGFNSMKYELWREKFSEKYPNQAWSVILKNLTLALGTQCDRDPKSWVAGLLEQTGLTGTNCVSKKENGGFYTPLLTYLYLYRAFHSLGVLRRWREKKEREKEKKW